LTATCLDRGGKHFHATVVAKHFLLGLGVEGIQGKAEGGLFRTSDSLGNGLWLWSRSSEDMRKPGRSQERDIIGAERKCVPNAQWDYFDETICQPAWREYH
jgi:hypothetical protein